MAKYSVIIPTKNAGQEFIKTLISIKSQKLADVEIIVIDSGSNDDTLKISDEYADTTLEIPSREFHHGRTRNKAAEKATGEVIIFTVQDAIPTNKEWLSRLVLPIELGDADITYGNQIAYPDAKPPDKFFYQYFYPDESIELAKEDTINEETFYIDNIFISDVNAAVSRRVWENLQFRDSVSMSEDKDFAYRAASAGYTIQYRPEAKVYHSHDYTLSSLFTRRYKDGKAFAELTAEGSTEFISDGIEYVWNEYSYLVSSGALPWIPYTLVYDFTYFTSFMLGKLHGSMPPSNQ